MFETNERTVYHNGKPRYNLSDGLIKKQGLTPEDVQELKRLHVYKLDIFEEMEETDNPDKLKILASKVEEVEFALQRAWKFPEDRNFHEWYRVPKCICPKMDNAERRGTPFGIIAQHCPIHGSKYV